MSRRRKPVIRTILPDPKYKNLVVTKFMNMVMEDGKKSIAEKIVFEERAAERVKVPGQDPWTRALRRVRI